MVYVHVSLKYSNYVRMDHLKIEGLLTYIGTWYRQDIHFHSIMAARAIHHCETGSANEPVGLLMVEVVRSDPQPPLRCMVPAGSTPQCHVFILLKLEWLTQQTGLVAKVSASELPQFENQLLLTSIQWYSVGLQILRSGVRSTFRPLFLLFYAVYQRKFFWCVFFFWESVSIYFEPQPAACWWVSSD